MFFGLKGFVSGLGFGWSLGSFLCWFCLLDNHEGSGIVVMLGLGFEGCCFFDIFRFVFSHLGLIVFSKIEGIFLGGHFFGVVFEDGNVLHSLRLLVSGGDGLGFHGFLWG